MLQSYATSTFISLAFGMVAVGYFAAYPTGAFTEMDVDKTGLGGRDAMFEGILYEGDENERGYFRTTIGANIYLCLYSYVCGEADAHQFNVVADEIHLFAERDKILLIVVENVTQQAT